MNNISDFDDIIKFFIFIYDNSLLLLNEYGGF